MYQFHRPAGNFCRISSTSTQLKATNRAFVLQNCKDWEDSKENRSARVGQICEHPWYKWKQMEMEDT